LQPDVDAVYLAEFGFQALDRILVLEKAAFLFNVNKGLY
jgi:hypothetical protein